MGILGTLWSRIKSGSGDNKSDDKQEPITKFGIAKVVTSVGLIVGGAALILTGAGLVPGIAMLVAGGIVNKTCGENGIVGSTKKAIANFPTVQKFGARGAVLTGFGCVGLAIVGIATGGLGVVVIAGIGLTGAYVANKICTHGDDGKSNDKGLIMNMIGSVGDVVKLVANKVMGKSNPEPELGGENRSAGDSITTEPEQQPQQSCSSQSELKGQGTEINIHTAQYQSVQNIKEETLAAGNNLQENGTIVSPQQGDSTHASNTPGQGTSIGGSQK